MENNDKSYDELLKLELEGRKKLSASAASICLEQWLGGTIRFDRDQVHGMVEKLDALLTRVETRARVLGWLEPEPTGDALEDVSDDN